MKKKRVETFRNIRYGDGRIIIQTAQPLWVPRRGSLRLAPIKDTPLFICSSKRVVNLVVFL